MHLKTAEERSPRFVEKIYKIGGLWILHPQFQRVTKTSKVWVEVETLRWLSCQSCGAPANRRSYVEWTSPKERQPEHRVKLKEKIHKSPLSLKTQIPKVEVQDFVFALMGFRIALVPSFQILLPFLPFWMRWRSVFSKLWLINREFVFCGFLFVCF